MLNTEIELGQKVQDTISGYTGIVNTIGDHISGCTRVGVFATGEEKTDTRGKEQFFYPDQLEIIEEENEYTEIDTVETVDFRLGARMKDKISEFEGVVTVINYHLYNCPQVALRTSVQPGVSQTGEIDWFDAPTLEEVDGDSFEGTFEALQEESSSSTGSISDKGPSMDSA